MKKETCERRFEKCMKQQCKSEPKQQECENNAAIYGLGVKMMGCKAYQESQTEACECSKDVETADRQRLTAFFNAYDPSALDSVDDLLLKYQGKRPVMFYRLLKKYPDALIVDLTKKDVEFDGSDASFSVGLDDHDGDSTDSHQEDHIEL